MRFSVRGSCWLLAILAGALAVIGGCEQARRQSNPGAEDLNLVWVVLDAAGARYFGSWGAGEESSPNIDVLARESVRFARAYAQYPTTLVSTASFLTGLYPPTTQTGFVLAS